MSLEISRAIELEEASLADGILTFEPNPQDLLTMHMWEAFELADAEEKVRDFQESNISETKMGEEAIKVTHYDGMDNASGVMNATEPHATLPEGPHSSVIVEEEEDWAAQFFEEEIPSADGQDSFTEIKTSSIGATFSSTEPALSSTEQSFASSNILATSDFNQYMLTDEELENAIKLGEEQLYGVPPVRNEAEQVTQKSQPTFQAQLLHAEEPVIAAEQVVPQMQCAHPTNTSLGQLYMPMHQQHNPGPQYSVNNTQVKARKAPKASKNATKALSTTVSIDARHDQTSQVSPDVVSDFHYGGEPEIMDGVMAHELNEIGQKEQSENGLAGLFGLTLDQTKSGMRNKNAGVRNTMAEKPKPAATHNLLRYAGVKKSKSPKAKLSVSPVLVQNDDEKTRPVPNTSPAREQPIDKPVITTEVHTKLPPFVTAEQYAMIQKAAKAKAFPVYCQALSEGIKYAQHGAAVQQKTYEAATQQSGQQTLYTSLNQPIQVSPYQLQQQVLQTVQAKHADQTPYYIQQLVERAIDPTSSMLGNNTTADNTEYVAPMTPGQSTMPGNQAAFCNMLQGTSATPYYAFVQGSQGAFYPSPQITPHLARQGSSYGSPIKASQGAGHQSANAQQMAAFDLLQQHSQIGVHIDTPQAWQLAQQGHQVQPQVYYPLPQQSQQPGRYYTPMPVQQPNGFAPTYDPQNHAQFVAQQHRMQQDQIQRQQIQQPGLLYQPTFQDNLNYSAKVAAQANAGNPKRQFKVEDFLNQRH